MKKYFRMKWSLEWLLSQFIENISFWLIISGGFLLIYSPGADVQSSHWELLGTVSEVNGGCLICIILTLHSTSFMNSSRLTRKTLLAWNRLFVATYIEPHHLIIRSHAVLKTQNTGISLYYFIKNISHIIDTQLYHHLTSKKICTIIT